MNDLIERLQINFQQKNTEEMPFAKMWVVQGAPERQNLCVSDSIAENVWQALFSRFSCCQQCDRGEQAEGMVTLLGRGKQLCRTPQEALQQPGTSD